MSYKQTVARVYRESVALYGLAGVNRQEAIEAATATIHAEILSGRLRLDVESAIRASLVKADEADGRSADAILKRAAAGDVPLTSADMDVVVTLGAGLRKQWADVRVADLDAMNDIRFKNFKAARDSYSEFNAAVIAVRPVLFEYLTFGAAFDAGGFPPGGVSASAAA